MQRSTFKVLFYVKRQSEKHGQVPVMGRITINGTMSQFSSKLSVRSSLWDAKANKASGRSLEAQRLNEKLENIKTNIGKHPLRYLIPGVQRKHEHVVKAVRTDTLLEDTRVRA